jgi:hypothetical protein
MRSTSKSREQWIRTRRLRIASGNFLEADFSVPIRQTSEERVCEDSSRLVRERRERADHRAFIYLCRLNLGE